MDGDKSIAFDANITMGLAGVSLINTLNEAQINRELRKSSPEVVHTSKLHQDVEIQKGKSHLTSQDIT